MDKEIITKIDEILSAHGVRNLSLDELGKVNGGAGIDDLTAAEKAHLKSLLSQYLSERQPDKKKKAGEQFVSFIDQLSEKYHWYDVDISELDLDFDKLLGL